MSSRLVAVSALDTIALATEAVRRQVSLTGELDTIFVIDSARRLCGILPIRQLFLGAADALVRDLMIAPVVHVAPGEDQEMVARVMGRYGLSSVPVVDQAGRLLGRVSATDLHDVAIGDVGDDLLRFGGVSAADRAGSGWRTAVRNRLPWLYANLLPAFGGAAVIFFFQGALVRIAVLAVWLPVIGGVSGNAGTQSLAVAVRRLVLEPRRRERIASVVAREAIAGIVNGAALGGAVALVAILLGESWKIGLVVLLAMVGNLTIAGIAGGVAPLLLRRAGRTPTELPATTLTAVIDAIGFALLLALASTLLR
jgi:magnesium transporter